MAGNSGGSYGGQQYGNSYMPSYNGYSMGGLQQMGQSYAPNYGGYSMGNYPQAFGMNNMAMSRNMYQPNYGMQNPYMFSQMQPQQSAYQPAALQARPGMNNWNADAGSGAGYTAGAGPAAPGPGVNPELAAMYGNRWNTDQR